MIFTWFWFIAVRFRRRCLLKPCMAKLYRQVNEQCLEWIPDSCNSIYPYMSRRICAHPNFQGNWITFISAEHKELISKCIFKGLFVITRTFVDSQVRLRSWKQMWKSPQHCQEYTNYDCCQHNSQYVTKNSDLAGLTALFSWKAYIQQYKASQTHRIHSCPDKKDYRCFV